MRGFGKKHGQVILYLAFAILAVLFIALLHVDVWLAIAGKNKAQNGGDAAALAAAREQGKVLNAIGRYNLDHVRAGLNREYARIDTITNEQARLALLGPLDGLEAAQVAARANGLPEIEGMDDLLIQQAKAVRAYFMGRVSPVVAELVDPRLIPQYCDRIEEIARAGIVAGPDNARFFAFGGNHLLYNKNFYSAVAGRDWCWFFFNQMALLEGYRSWHDWGPPSGAKLRPFRNSEIFDVGVTPVHTSLLEHLTPEDVQFLLKDNGYGNYAIEEIANCFTLTNRSERWYFYEPSEWGEWTLIDPDDHFPVYGHVKDVYNVFGASAVCRVEKPSKSVSVGGSDHTFTWSAAAKPFGVVHDPQRREQPVTFYDFFVLPGFTDVRLIPVDAASGGALTTADYNWVVHIRDHVPGYLEMGLAALRNCWYCKVLRRWETAAYRQQGLLWLKFHSGSCKKPVGGHGGGGGPAGGAQWGTSRAH